MRKSIHRQPGRVKGKKTANRFQDVDMSSILCSSANTDKSSREMMIQHSRYRCIGRNTTDSMDSSSDKEQLNRAIRIHRFNHTERRDRAAEAIRRHC